MIGPWPRPSPDVTQRRGIRILRGARAVLAGVVVVLAHLGGLWLLRQAPEPAPAPAATPAPPEMLRLPYRLARPSAKRVPPHPQQGRRRVAARGPSATPARNPSAAGGFSTPPLPTSSSATTEPTKSDYGRWTVKPGGGAPPGRLEACTSEALASLIGAARTACERRLADLAPGAAQRPAFPLSGDKRTAAEMEKWAQYTDDLFKWKRSRENTPHPCQPQDTPVHKLYLDKCALHSGAIVFKYRF